MRISLSELTQRFRSSCFWLLIGALAGVLTLVVVLGVGYVSRLNAFAEEPATPDLIVVGYPTETAERDTIAVETATSMPTPSPTLPPAPGESFFIGQLVMVAGTGGDGLRFRTQPGLSGTIGFLAYENEVFRVEGGPQEVDGYVWWFLVNPYDNSKSGWAAAVFLRPIEDQ